MNELVDTTGERSVGVGFAGEEIRLSRMVSLGSEKSQGRIALIALVERAEVRSGP